MCSVAVIVASNFLSWRAFKFWNRIPCTVHQVVLMGLLVVVLEHPAHLAHLGGTSLLKDFPRILLLNTARASCL